jgi:hypothetical protein
MRYSELRLSVKICASSWGNSWLRISNVWWMANISARRMFCRPINLCNMFILSGGFHIPYLVLASSQITSVTFLRGMNDPLV